jgi:hypothetical protein
MVLHKLTNDLALLGTVRQWVVLLLLFIQRVNYIQQVARWEVMQSIRWVRVPEHDDQWAVEVRGTIHFELIGKCVALELVAIALQEEDVQA